MKTCLECILILILDFYVDVINSGDLPNVPDTIVIKPPPATLSTTTQPSLTIYYDAMEENSQVFFNTTLVKEFGCFSSYVDISFIPCQRATVHENALACVSNVDPLCNLDKVHSCAIAQLTNKTQLVDFLACTMCSVKKLPDFLTCAIRHGVDEQQLQSCASSNTGKTLCQNHAAQKMPACDTMPGFIFKNPDDIQATDPFEHLDNYLNNVCVTDLQSALCAQLKSTRATNIPPECNKKLVLGIFYKTMDANSQKWFQTFAKVYETFSSCLTIKYEPCMFAELSHTGKLDCKDQADTDCVAARTHACAVSMINDPNTLFNFIDCAMKNSTTVPDFHKCATDNNIAYDLIKKCADSDTGKMLCYDYSKTRPKSNKIPSFSYELTFNETISEATSSAKDLQSAICQQMTKYEIICPACRTAYGTCGGGTPHSNTQTGNLGNLSPGSVFG